MSSKKVFTLVKVGQHKVERGEYTGSSPLGAAKKAFNRFCREKKLKTCSSTALVMQNKNTNKLYYYVAERKKMSTPKVVDRGGVKVTYEYENVVKSKKT